MIVAGVLTHITARHSVARQTEAQAGMQQTAIMNKVMLYLFPIGVVVGAPFLPLAILLYWVANNLWTLGQQYVVYRKIDREEAERKQKAIEQRSSRAPRPGQKPDRSRPATAANGSDVDGQASDGATSGDTVQPADESAAAGAASNGDGAGRPAKRRPQARNLRLSRGTSGADAGAPRAESRPAGSGSSPPNNASNGSAPSGEAKPGSGQPSGAKTGSATSGSATSGSATAGGAKTGGASGGGAKPSGAKSGGTKAGGSGAGNQPGRRPVTAKKGRKRR
jgi:YidC/Oxa1 family membrane protein insertase